MLQVTSTQCLLRSILLQLCQKQISGDKRVFPNRINPYWYTRESLRSKRRSPRVLCELSACECALKKNSRKFSGVLRVFPSHGRVNPYSETYEPLSSKWP